MTRRRWTRGGEARLAPIVTVPAEDDISIPLVFTNPSEGVVRFAVDAGGAGLRGLEGALYQDGQKIKTNYRPLARPVPPAKHHVRELKPSATAVVRYPLPNLNLKPGRYELRLTYQVYPGSTDEKEFGLTPMKLEQTIMVKIE